MLPAILGLGGLTAKIIATAVIPRVVRAISQSLSTTRAAEPCPPPPVEGISSGPEPAPPPVLSGVSGTRISSRKWAYAGLWHHAPSGLDLATYRIYDAANKRWISRDPLGEDVDYNLYRYCGNNPINFVDPHGLCPLRRTREKDEELEKKKRRTRKAPLQLRFDDTIYNFTWEIPVPVGVDSVRVTNVHIKPPGTDPTGRSRIDIGGLLMDALFINDPVTGEERQTFDYSQSPERGGSGHWDVVRSEMGRSHFDLSGDLEYLNSDGTVIGTSPFEPRIYDGTGSSSDIPSLPGFPGSIFQ